MKRRLVYQCHVFGYCVKGCPNGIYDRAAAFLIGAGDDHYLTAGGWHSEGGDNGTLATHWFPELFAQPLGEPLSDAVYDPAIARWSRAFKSGTKVTFDTRTNKGNIMWKDSAIQV